ncbi:MAG TPA: nuclear transport factor 2 family protein [Solirubrobacteraceae bacterium]|nr:nuclear transport factor 2 family protein [Solirubrobacteraceae bacterium]
MSRENVEQVREAVDAFNRRDLDAYLGLMEPDVELTPYERVVEGLGPYRGHDGVRTWWRETLAALPDLRAELDQLRDLGDMVFARGHLRGTGSRSGAPIERTLWIAVEVRDGKAVSWHTHASEAEALKAVGLEE